MAAKWQQWMPFHIDRFKGSPAVQAMHPVARIGYLYLLSCQWQSDSCSISADSIDLADMSGLGDELWAMHAPRILRSFETLENGQLRNAVCFAEWTEAKKVFDRRCANVERTNSKRSAHDERHTVTGTGTGTKTGTEGKEPPPDPPKPRTPSPGANGEFALAVELGQEIKLAMRNSDIALVAQVIANESAEHGGPFEAKNFIRDAALAAQARGQPVNIFWLQDRKFAIREMDQYERYLKGA